MNGGGACSAAVFHSRFGPLLARLQLDNRGRSMDTEFGSSSGDARENDPSLPGFTNERDVLFRSHVQHAYRFAYDAAGDPRFAGREFDEAEKDLEAGWLNVRFAGDEWQAVRDYAREGFNQGRQIGLACTGGVIGETPSHERPSFADPIAEGIDPTSPESPEQQA